ncbi:unnamed protein product [Arctia plantaginis]|nr:unnamed protein product [Arctia plantaginis]CAB3225944.1 unnamed protein product [Arctia plantaginis]
MDRCRCEDYSAAVKKIKFFTVGTLRPDILDNFDRSQYVTAWVKNGISLVDLRFLKPRAWKKVPPSEVPEDQSSERRRQIEEMWCPYMTPFKLEMFETDQQ